MVLNGTPLGVFPEADLEGAVLQLEPGDRLLFGTDGFFEVLRRARRPFQDLAPGQWQALGGLAPGLGAERRSARRPGATATA